MHPHMSQIMAEMHIEELRRTAARYRRAPTAPRASSKGSGPEDASRRGSHTREETPCVLC